MNKDTIAHVGNMAAMREACTNIAKYANAAKCHTTDAHILGYLDQIESWAKTAIAKPPRNCDVGTAEEQRKRFQDFCVDSQVDEDYTSMCARCTLRREKHCELTWAQMPYEEGGAK